LIGIVAGVLPLAILKFLQRIKRERWRKEMAVTGPNTALFSDIIFGYSVCIPLLVPISLYVAFDSLPWWVLLASLGAAILGIFLSSALIAISQDPPLPRIKLTKDKTVIDGWLLDRSGGTWYFFETSTKVLTSIPDGEVKEVQIIRTDSKRDPLEEAPEPPDKARVSDDGS
jgi:hypothetical protein